MYFRFLLLLVLISSSCQAAANLEQLEAQVRLDLVRINVPAFSWLKPVDSEEHHDHVLDVAIIGGGMAGLTTAFALIKEGITNIQIFDENAEGQEGPWENYARMKHLRSPKALMGPALDISSLTFRSWHEACYGKQAWQDLDQIPTLLWSAYLKWYRKVLKLPVVNLVTLKALVPHEKLIELRFENDDRITVVHTRKVVLATGRSGFGGKEIPPFVANLPLKAYAHTNDLIEASSLKNKRVAVIGCGAAAFDAAADALEKGALEVMMLVRRSNLPLVNKFSQFFSAGMQHGFFELPDEMRCLFFSEGFECGTPPPKEAVERVKGHNRFHLCLDTSVVKADLMNRTLILHTTKGKKACDFLILATGYSVDGYQRPELQGIMDNVRLWENSLPNKVYQEKPKMGRFPYLGSHFQLLEKEKGQAPYLKNIYCFNYGAFLSHGLISGDIPGISSGARRLAAGIASDFFNENAEWHLNKLKQYDIPLFDLTDM